jgi:signal transduction histidine kinase/BarA-like signal transduction histidine kinase
MKSPDASPSPERKFTEKLSGEFSQELRYLRRISEQNAAKILSLDSQSIAIRHELEQKRRGFALLAELAVASRGDADYGSVFVSIARRLNAALNMERTAVLRPDKRKADGKFGVAVLQGYPTDREKVIAARTVRVDAELLDPDRPVLVTGADPLQRLATLREALELPYLISSPVFLHNEVAAILITGRVQEQLPFLPRLGHHDVETVQTVSAHLAAVLTEQRLAEAEKRTQIMLDTTPLCANFWDERYRHIDCNQEAVRLFGLSSKGEYLDRFDELSPEFQPDGSRSSEAMRAKIRDAFVSGYERFEWVHQKPDGEPIPADVILARVERGGGYIVVGYTRDLREQKAMLAEMLKTEDELRRARDLAEKNARAKSEFLANMSHEIRTPMNAIVGMTHLLTGVELDERARKYVDQAAHAANLLLRVIDDILEFSQIDTGRMKLETAPFSLRDLMRGVEETVEEQAKGKSLTLSVHIAPDVPALLLGDSLRLEQVLLNLASNAVKFTAAGGVDIRVFNIFDISDNAPPLGKAQLLFEVEDTGIGIDKELAEQLFSPFTQADASSTRKYGGLGLGLAISRSLVEMMAGEIQCESRVGEGSKFSFTAFFDLPKKEQVKEIEQRIGQKIEQEIEKREIKNEQENDDIFPEDAHGLEDLCGMRVLLVEDNKINQMIATELLSDMGVVVSTAENGLEALEALENDIYDLVLMDIQMPEMDGLTATAHIRANPKYANLPVLALTAHALADDREESLRHGMNDHLTKPIDPDQLFEALKHWRKPPKPA